MKKNASKRVLSAFLAFVMVFLMVPFSVFTAFAVEETEQPKIDYSPFLIESVNGRVVYNAQTADLCYRFYLDARAHLDSFEKYDKYEHLQPVSFGFAYNDFTYTMESAYCCEPDWYPSCGLLSGVLNFQLPNNEIQHVMMIAFDGTDFDEISDVITDSNFVTSDNGYHEGFEQTADRHYDDLHHTSYDLGEGNKITFSEYLTRMSDNDNYTMIVVGHSLGAAVAGVFTSKYINYDASRRDNVMTYTFASPYICNAVLSANAYSGNIINFVNKDDLVTKIGAFKGDRIGIDYSYRLGKYTRVGTNLKEFLTILDLYRFIKQSKKTFKDVKENHHMGTAYLPTKNHINSHINEYTNAFVLYNNYDEATHTYQRIVFNNGQLIVSGSGALDGNWTENTLVEWAKVKNDCTSLVFDTDCKITEIGDYAFAGLSTLAGTLTLPQTVTTIGDYAFFHCSGFTNNLIIPSKVMYIGVNAFCGCSSIEYVNVAQVENVDKLQLEYGAFSNCGIYGIEYPLAFEHLFSTQTIWNAYTYRNTYVGANNKMIDYVTTVKCSTEDGNFHSYAAPGSYVYLNDFKYSHIEVFLLENTTNVSDDSLKLCKENDYAIVHDSGFIEIKDDAPTASSNKSYGFTVVGIRDKNVDINEFNAFVDTHGRVPYEIDTHIYFEIKSESDSGFAGGYGTVERPYLISTFDHVTNLANKSAYYDNSEYHFQLIDDIDGGGVSFGCVPSFAGNFDGNYHSIYNFNMNGWSIYRGFFISLSKGATVKNLTIGCTNIETSLSCPEGWYDDTYFGTLAGRNNGTIENCHVINAKVFAENKEEDSAAICEAGGLIGINAGKVTNSSVVSSQITAYAKGTDYNSSYAYAGGLIAQTTAGSEVDNCYVESTKVITDAYSIVFKLSNTHTIAVSGALVGEIAGGTIFTNFAYDVNCSYSAYAKNGYTANEETTGYDKISTPLSIQKKFEKIEIIKKPHVRIYFVEEELNIAGLQVNGIYADESSMPITGFSVSQFNNAEAGDEIPVMVSWNGLSTFFFVKVKKVEPVKLVVKVPDKTYLAGQKINKALLKADELEVFVLFNDGTQKTITGYSVETVTPETSGRTRMLLEEEVEINGETYEMFVDFSVNVTCAHDSTTLSNATSPTTTEYGYTGDLVCSTCKSIVEEGSIVDMLECIDHNYGAWENHDETQHSRVCACGEVEYATHNWNSGTITKPATHLAAGERTKTCSDCGATKIEAIDSIANHSFGSWEMHDENQHIRACACGEKEYDSHNWDSGVVTLEPTYTTEGVKTYTCVDCGATKTETFSIPPLPDDAPYIIVEDKTAMIGKPITVKINLKNNPGITTMRIKVAYDSSMLKLTDVTYNTAIGGQSILPENINTLNGNLILYWTDGFVNYEGDDVFAALTFLVSDDAIGATTIAVTYDAEDIYDADESNVTFACDDGVITFIDYIPGDINGDGVLNSKDTTRLMRYLAGWDVEINEAALDVNGDGVVNTKDTTRLMRYLAGWDVEIH